MEDSIRIRLKLTHESVLSYINSAQSALKLVADGELSFNELEIIEYKLKAAKERFVTEIHNYCNSITNPDLEEISRFTAVQIQAEDLTAEINVYLKRNRTNGTVGEDNLKMSSKLPRMELAKFDGNILKWYQFWDQFSSNVDSRNISEVDKLLYLQSVLEGEARQAIDGLDTTNKNYQIAVKTLKERYGKPNVIIDAHYVALYRIKAASKSVRECRQVLNEIERHLRVLSSLGEDVNHNHLRVMIIEKFPGDLIYELRLKLTEDNESIDIIRKYLEYIISARETSSRLKGENEGSNTENTTGENKHNTEHYTLDSLHVRCEEKINDHDKQQRPIIRREKPRVEYRPYNKFKQFPRKRPHSVSDRDHEPPNKKLCKKCIFCKQDHYNDECTVYKTVQERKATLGKRCYNCFGLGHRLNNCQSKRKCRHCNKLGAHNRALCPKLVYSSKLVKTDILYTESNISTTLLQTCIATVSCSEVEPRELQCRLLLDSGSQRSYITSSVASVLNLSTLENICLSIFTFGTKSPQHIESPLVNFTIKTRTGIIRSVYDNVVPYITNSVRAPVFKDLTKILQNRKLERLILADDGSCGGKIDILIGNDYYHSFMSNNKISIDKGLFLVETDFGWVWSGKIQESSPGDQLAVLTYFQTAGSYDSKLNEPDLPLKADDVKKLWDLESIGITDSPNCRRDEEAVKQFNETIQYKHNRYHVKWPWTEYPPNLPNNFGLAYGRLTNLLKRLDNFTIRAYDKVIKEQLDTGVIEVVSDASTPKTHPVHYLPHHCVFNREKPDKLRIVYDASAKSTGNQSLNECLYRGPLMLEDLTGLLIKFREHAIGIVADVEKAFLQLGLQEPDKDVTRFIWLKNINESTNRDNILILRFCRVPFGIISSPFLLNATIKYHLSQSKNVITKKIACDIYVDNIVTGAQTIREAKELYTSSRQSFNSISMNLREWNSNSKELVSFIPNQFQAENNSLVKVLGLKWDTISDRLYLKYNLNKQEIESANTKRDILKVIASIYDPCGFAVPIVLPAKLFFQNLWKQKISWDTRINENLLREWRQLSTTLHSLQDISINRYYLKDMNKDRKDSGIMYELHCFTDASKEAYAACIYLRSSSGTNNIVTFIIGKSRLVPIKDQGNLQIPKLELLGVLIGSRLLRYVNKFLRLNIIRQFLWTDSQIVLSWYNSNKLLPPFISRRINDIKQHKTLIVRYVPGQYNPADIGTRSDRIGHYNRWLKGPDFLLQGSELWSFLPDSNNWENIVQTQTSSAGESLSNKNKNKVVVDDKVVNSKENDNKQYYDNDEELKTILELQAMYFPKEVRGENTDFSRSLGIYKDQRGVLRCKGRFKHTDWTHNQKVPILLPKNSNFTRKLIANIHNKNYHVGVSHTLSLLRNKFWVPQGRSVVQNVLKKCQSCLKYGGGPFKLPPMPDLPPERVKFNPPFTFTGLDYFGPMIIENGNREKRWVCLFTCLTVRAIHLEMVKDLSSEECLLALRRFAASRGLPQLIISDNATQFKLTAEVLCSDYCIQNKIRWRFIPELAPWFGGFYERLIGLVKHSLRRTIDNHLLSQNQLYTVLKEIEAIVNTRPLTTVGAELEHILSPSDFLRVGGPTVTEISSRELLEPVTVTKFNLIEGWKRGQVITEEFAKMFKGQYLTSLRERSNTHRQPRVLVDRIPKLGETVQIKAEGSRANWKVGKIVELIRGSDDQIRVAKVKLQSGEILTRSVGHLYPLEIEEEFVEEVKTSARVDHNQETITRPVRLASRRAKERIKQWTSQLMITLFRKF